MLTHNSEIFVRPKMVSLFWVSLLLVGKVFVFFIFHLTLLFFFFSNVLQGGAQNFLEPSVPVRGAAHFCFLVFRGIPFAIMAKSYFFELSFIFKTFQDPTS